MGLRLTLPGRNIVVRRVALAACATILLTAGSAGRGEAYRFYSLGGSDAIGTAADAFRWDAADFPLRFHLQDNIPDFFDEDRWRNVVRDSLDEWSGILTADIRLSLEPGFAEGDGVGREDGVLTVGWVSLDEDQSAVGGRASLWMRTSTGRIEHCDIQMNAAPYGERLAEGGDIDKETARIRNNVVHEVGHCLGLRHTEPHPIPGWLSSDRIPAGFRPETTMSYSFGRVAETSEDEKVAVSLLYPAAGFASLRGAVSGRVAGARGTLPFVYVQAVYPGVRPRMGPGAFADEDGYFHLEGLEPGTVVLWAHPILIHYSNAHGNLLAMAFEGGGLDVVDQWQWVRVAGGETVGVPDITLAVGRPR